MIALDGRKMSARTSRTKKNPAEGECSLQHNVVDPWDIEKTFMLGDV